MEDTPKTKTPTAPVTVKLMGMECETEATQIAPGLYIPTEQLPQEAVPQYGYVKFVKQGDVYQPVIRGWGKAIRMRPSLKEALGLDLPYKTIMRLIKGGFIAARVPAPNTYLMDLDSFYEHIEASKDPEFWTPERRHRYSLTTGDV